MPGTRRGGLPGLCVLLLVLAAGPAEAQVARRPAGAERGFITFDAVVQAAAGDLSDRLFFEANAETGTIEAQYPGRTGVGVDGGFGIRVRGRMGVAVAVSHAASSGVASVVAEVPHPFFDDRHRHVEGEAPDISRTETAVHLQLYYEPEKVTKLLDDLGADYAWLPLSLPLTATLNRSGWHRLYTGPISAVFSRAESPAPLQGGTLGSACFPGP